MKWLQNMLGISELITKVDAMDQKIADLSPILKGLADDVQPIGDSLQTVIDRLQQLQRNSNNPSVQTNLTADDQASLNAAVSQASQLKDAFDQIRDKLQQAAANPNGDAGGPQGTQVNSNQDGSTG